VLLGLGLAALVLVVALWQPWQVRDLHQAGLVDLQEVETLQARFNDDAGNSRLIIIVAPT
jgi:hypothetical protein